MDSRNGKTREERRETGITSDPPSRSSLTRREGTPYNRSRTSLNDSNSSIEQAKKSWKERSAVSFKKCSKHSLKRKLSKSAMQDEGNAQASNDSSKKAGDHKQQSAKEATPSLLSRNPFINFLREYRRKHKEKLAKLSQVEIVRTCAEEWRKLPAKEKTVYVEQAARAPRSRRRRSRRRRSRTRSRSYSPNFSPQTLRRSRSRRGRKGSKRRKSKRKGRRSRRRRRFTF